MNILVATLGASWAVIPELYGLMAHDSYPLYRHHPRLKQLLKVREEHKLFTPDEIWVCTTTGERTNASLKKLTAWWQLLGEPVPLRVWRAADCERLASPEECATMRELICRLITRALDTVNGRGQVVLSLAGGRKTMSADMQWAGSVLGANALLHVIGPEPIPEPLRIAEPATFNKPLNADWLGELMPMVVGTGSRSDFMDIELDGQCIDSATYPITLAEPECLWRLPSNAEQLSEAIVRREKMGVQLLGNYLSSVSTTETFANWRTLYSLPPATIRYLQTTQLSKKHTHWLNQLPKADLHRHIGGSIGFEEQVKVARAVYTSLTTEECQAAVASLPSFVSKATWPDDWPARLKSVARNPAVRAAQTAVLFHQCSTETLKSALFPAYARVALKTRHPAGFSAYEKPGELSGSAILGHRSAIDAYAKAVVKQALGEGIRYLELRGSPNKYQPDSPVEFLTAFKVALSNAGAQVCNRATDKAELSDSSVVVSFIWILDRRSDMCVMKEQIQIACDASDALQGFLVGFDIAGDECARSPAEMASGFEPVFEQCLNVTIHAGEGEDAENIWQAAYKLHADRIGHGLTLAQSEPLLRRFRDKAICLELCPTSNREVVGFYDPAYPEETKDMSTYPLRSLIDAGVPITLCTDNPGFSNTSLADEMVTASRMSNGISLWETLAIVRKGYQHAFVNANVKDKLMKAADREIYDSLARIDGIPL